MRATVRPAITSLRTRRVLRSSPVHCRNGRARDNLEEIALVRGIKKYYRNSGRKGIPWYIVLLIQLGADRGSVNRARLASRLSGCRHAHADGLQPAPNRILPWTTRAVKCSDRITASSDLIGSIGLFRTTRASHLGRDPVSTEQNSALRLRLNREFEKGRSDKFSEPIGLHFFTYMSSTMPRGCTGLKRLGDAFRSAFAHGRHRLDFMVAERGWNRSLPFPCIALPDAENSLID